MQGADRVGTPDYPRTRWPLEYQRQVYFSSDGGHLLHIIYFEVIPLRHHVRLDLQYLFDITVVCRTKHQTEAYQGHEERGGWGGGSERVRET